jgi:hypothetical protein
MPRQAPQAQLGHPFGDGQHSSHRKAINMSGNCTSWSSERIELLKRCFHAGLSCSQIAREIGVTRNAVIGKKVEGLFKGASIIKIEAK